VHLYCVVLYDVCGHVFLRALIRVLNVLSQRGGLIEKGLHEAILPEGEPILPLTVIGAVKDSSLSSTETGRFLTPVATLLY